MVDDVQRLLASKADVLQRAHGTGSLAIHVACNEAIATSASGNVQPDPALNPVVVKMVLDAGSPVNERDRINRPTPPLTLG